MMGIVADNDDGVSYNESDNCTGDGLGNDSDGSHICITDSGMIMLKVASSATP